MLKYIFILMLSAVSLCIASSDFHIKTPEDLNSFASKKDVENLIVSLMNVGDIQIDVKDHPKLKSVSVTQCQNTGNIILNGNPLTHLSSLTIAENKNVIDVGAMGFTTDVLKLSQNNGFNSIYVVNSTIKNEIDIEGNQTIKKIAVDNASKSIPHILIQRNSAFEECAISGETIIDNITLKDNHSFTTINLPKGFNNMQMNSSNKEFKGIKINP